MTHYRRITASALPSRETSKRDAKCERCGNTYGTSEPSRRATFRGLLLCKDCRDRKGDGEWFMEKAGT